jgi:hypothetical protein
MNLLNSNNNSIGLQSLLETDSLTVHEISNPLFMTYSIFKIFLMKPSPAVLQLFGTKKRDPTNFYVVKNSAGQVIFNINEGIKTT